MPECALIVGAAPAPGAASFYRELITGCELVIAADGGAGVCLEAGRTPDLVVGDLDSADAALLAALKAAGTPIERHAAAKDASDLDLAAAAASRLGARHLVFTAAFSARVDHTLAAFGTLLRFAAQSPEVAEASFHAYLLSPHGTSTLELAEEPATVISLFALVAPATVSGAGFAFPLENTALEPLGSLGLSNRAAAQRQRLEVAHGTVLVVVSRPLPQDGNVR